MTLRELIWMLRGRQEDKRLDEESAYWRMAFLRAEIFNAGLSMVKSWGGAKDVDPRTPKQMNPVLQDDGEEISRATAAAFEHAAAMEARKNGRQILN